jgi:Zn-dependent protease/predicted transcriptional regulator
MIKGSFKIGRLLGIDVYIHFTFLLLLGFVGITHWVTGRSLEAALGGVLFFAGLFICVLLHEYGHALAARRYGIGTKDITLLPIGGLARLERIPEKPVQELVVALAGPAVNVVIAVGLVAGLVLTGRWEPLSSLSTTQGNIVERLVAVNLFLVLFNLLPAFPMDGGRVLRSLLAMSMDYARATRIAGRTGQVMAGIFGFVGLFSNPMLLLIALFVWIGASQEMGAAQTRSALSGVTVGQAMITDFRVVNPDDRLGEVARLVLAGSQQDFPVVSGGSVVGLLDRRHLIEGLGRLGPEGKAMEAMRRDMPDLGPTEFVEAVLSRNQQLEWPTIPVLLNGRLVGLFTVENVMELMMLKSALGPQNATPLGTSGWQTILNAPRPVPTQL